MNHNRSDWIRERPQRLRRLFEAAITFAVLAVLLVLGLCAGTPR